MFIPLWMYLIGITVAWLLGMVTGYEIGFKRCLNALKKSVVRRHNAFSEKESGK